MNYIFFTIGWPSVSFLWHLVWLYIGIGVGMALFLIKDGYVATFSEKIFAIIVFMFFWPILISK